MLRRRRRSRLLPLLQGVQFAAEAHHDRVIRSHAFQLGIRDATGGQSLILPAQPIYLRPPGVPQGQFSPQFHPILPLMEQD